MTLAHLVIFLLTGMHPIKSISASASANTLIPRAADFGQLLDTISSIAPPAEAILRLDNQVPSRRTTIYPRASA